MLRDVVFEEITVQLNECRGACVHDEVRIRSEKLLRDIVEHAEIDGIALHQLNTAHAELGET